jgi:pantothenate synthetase
MIAEGEIHAKKILKEIANLVGAEPEATLEYAVVADPVSLEPLSKIQGQALIAVGAKIGQTSLNDSLLLEEPPR